MYCREDEGLVGTLPVHGNLITCNLRTVGRTDHVPRWIGWDGRGAAAEAPFPRGAYFLGRFRMSWYRLMRAERLVVLPRWVIRLHKYPRRIGTEIAFVSLEMNLNRKCGAGTMKKARSYLCARMKSLLMRHAIRYTRHTSTACKVPGSRTRLLSKPTNACNVLSMILLPKQRTS